ncbi:DgyrCDS2464 [Dimorphilus gyrociliatus]|uniref:DgyrCDS2464 n=1 Tax=Dimorphilus gyrociliatus TaxID=2664684 RepID=A0A7I8VD56_9ANNE|nr:DgyrCDS2464 [Dimorphilus gyrociliatus]
MRSCKLPKGIQRMPISELRTSDQQRSRNRVSHGFQGFEIKPRAKTDNLMKFMLIFRVDKKFRTSGRVVKVSYYQNVYDEGVTTFYTNIFQTNFDGRPSPNHYKPAKYARCDVQRGGINECVIDIKFNINDVIGVFFPENSAIPYSQGCSSEEEDSTQLSISKEPIENLEAIMLQPVEFYKVDCREYSLNFTYVFD